MRHACWLRILVIRFLLDDTDAWLRLHTMFGQNLMRCKKLERDRCTDSFWVDECQRTLLLPSQKSHVCTVSVFDSSRNSTMTVNASSHSSGEGHESPEIPGPFLFPFFCLGVGVLFDALFSQSMATVFLLGISFGLTHLAVNCLGTTVVDEIFELYTWAGINPYYIMFALLPTLIFESAFALDAHHFKRFAGQLLTFAGPAFVLAFLTMGGMMNILMYFVGDASWNIGYCMLFGAVVSATDPVAVVALLKALGVPHHLKVLIEGESLFNDGAAIFSHGLIHIVLKKQQDPKIKLTEEISWRLFGVTMSVVIGYVYAQVTAKFLVTLYDSVRERAVVVIAVYASYASAEVLKGSGVLCLVVYGIALNSQRQWMSSEAYIDNKRMWGFLAYFANCIIFIITGMLTARDMYELKEEDHVYIAYGVITYLFAVISRWAAVIIFAALVVRRFGPYPPEFSPILIWGGLRGALALLLALQSREDGVIIKISQLAGKSGNHLFTTTLVFISMIVVFSNLIQGVTSGPLTQKLGLCGMSPFQVEHMKAVMKRLNEMIKEMIEIKKKEPRYAQANWRYVEKHVKLEVHLEKEEKVHEGGPGEDPEEEARECVQRCYEAQLWNMWRSGFLSVDIRALQNAINEAASTHGALNVEHLYQHLKSSRIRRYLGLFFLKYGGTFDASHCRWFADKPQLMDAWHMVSAIIACSHGVFSIYLYIMTGKGGVSQLFPFANALVILFLACEPLFRLWSERMHIRKIFLKRFVIWPWIDSLSVAVYIAVFAAYVFMLNECKPPEEIKTEWIQEDSGAVGICHKKQCLVLLEGVKPEYCSALRPVILFGAVSLIKLPQVLFLICRFLIHVEIAGSLQRKDEEALEGLNALISMTQTVKDRLDDGTLVRDEDLQKKLSEECRIVKTAAEKKVVAVLKKDVGVPLMATIKTRQVCRELLYQALLALKKLEEDGDLGEAECERLTHTIDMCQRRVQGLHRLTRKAVHEDSEKSAADRTKKKSSAGTKKKE